MTNIIRAVSAVDFSDWYHPDTLNSNVEEHLALTVWGESLERSSLFITKLKPQMSWQHFVAKLRYDPFEHQTIMHATILLLCSCLLIADTWPLDEAQHLNGWTHRSIDLYRCIDESMTQISRVSGQQVNPSLVHSKVNTAEVTLRNTIS